METHGYTVTFEEVGVQQHCQNPLTTFSLCLMPEGKAWIVTLQSTVSELVSELFDLLSSAEARAELFLFFNDWCGLPNWFSKNVETSHLYMLVVRRVEQRSKNLWVNAPALLHVDFTWRSTSKQMKKHNTWFYECMFHNSHVYCNDKCIFFHQKISDLDNWKQLDSSALAFWRCFQNHLRQTWELTAWPYPVTCLH